MNAKNKNQNNNLHRWIGQEVRQNRQGAGLYRKKQFSSKKDDSAKESDIGRLAFIDVYVKWDKWNQHVLQHPVPLFLQKGRGGLFPGSLGVCFLARPKKKKRRGALAPKVRAFFC